jgi:hypothetical protein
VGSGLQERARSRGEDCRRFCLLMMDPRISSAKMIRASNLKITYTFSIHTRSDQRSSRFSTRICFVCPMATRLTGPLQTLSRAECREQRYDSPDRVRVQNAFGHVSDIIPHATDKESWTDQFQIRGIIKRDVRTISDKSTRTKSCFCKNN